MPAVEDATADELLGRLLVSPEAHADPYPLYEAIRRRAPLLRSGLGPLVVSRYDDAVATLRDPRLGRGSGRRRPDRRSLVASAADPELRQAFFERSAKSMLFADPPDHGRLRRLVSRAFTPRRVVGLRPAVSAMVAGYLDAMAEVGEVDVMTALAFPLPNDVIGELVGVPPADRAGFQGLVRDAAAGIEPVIDGATAQAAIAAQARLGDYFTALLAERRASPRDDLMTGLVEAAERDDRLSDGEIVSTAILLFSAGFETTTNLIGNGLLALLRHPGELARLRSRPDLVAPAVEELLRFDSPVQFNSRCALVDADVAGEPLPAGKEVIVLQGGANRDPERFAEPDRLDVGRVDVVPLSFGWGAHHCIGAPLARMEGACVFGALAARFERIELLEASPPWRDRLTLHGLERLPVRVAIR